MNDLSVPHDSELSRHHICYLRHADQEAAILQIPAPVTSRLDYCNAVIVELLALTTVTPEHDAAARLNLDLRACDHGRSARSQLHQLPAQFLIKFKLRHVRGTHHPYIKDTLTSRQKSSRRPELRSGISSASPAADIVWQAGGLSFVRLRVWN